MTILTADQIAYIRDNTGDDCTPPIVSDAKLQLYYDAASGEMTCAIASVLRVLFAKAKAGASRITDFGTSVDTSEQDHLKDLLDYWDGQCGSGGGAITPGVIGLGLDADQAWFESLANRTGW